MDVVLDELTLVDCVDFDVSLRIHELARALVALDKLGAPRSLRSVADAQFRSISGGHGLAKWCFDKSVDRDAGRLVANRLSVQPFIDGVGGLLRAAEGEGAVECKVSGVNAVGLTYCFIVDGLLVGLQSSSFPHSCDRQIVTYWLSESGEGTEETIMRLVVSAMDVRREERLISAKVLSWLRTGVEVMERSAELFPRLKFGERAVAQLSSLSVSDSAFTSILRHLRALQEAAESTVDVSEFDPKCSWSVESDTTLKHAKYGTLRMFPWPDGYSGGQWSYHSKTGTTRIYFAPKKGVNGIDVCIGYVGRHLPTVRFPN